MNSGRRRYQLLSTLGSGGFGTVYQALLLGGGGFTKNVALKLPHPDQANDPDVAQRIREEARMLGLVRHRAIVHVDSLVLLNGSWTVVMEYVEGVDLSRALRHGLLPVRVALAIVEEVVSALHVAYATRGPEGDELRLVHRDIKPSNVLLTAAGEVKLLDFGIARADLDAYEVTTLSNAGSRLYMSPERLDGIDDARADVYSLGAVLFELLTGRAFGKTSGHPERHSQRLRLAIAHLRAEVGGLGEGVAALVGDMLAYDPKDRPWPRDVERRAADLGASLGGPRLRDWAERHVPGLLAERGANAPLHQLVLSEQTEEEAAQYAPLPLGMAPGDTTDLPELPLSAIDQDVLGDDVEAVDRMTRPAFEVAGNDDTTTIHFVGPADDVNIDTATGAPARIDHVLVDATGTPAPQARRGARGVPAKAPTKAPPRRTLAPLALMLGASALVTLLLVGLAGVLMFGGEPDVPTLDAGEPVAVPEVVPAVVVDPAAQAQAPVVPAPAPVVAPVPKPITIAPVPERPRMTAVSVSGDAASVALVAGVRRHTLPASVPPGDYAIEATFGGRSVGAGRVVVTSAPVNITCRALFLRCSAE